MSLRTKSAQKQHRQSLKRRERNRFVTSTLKTKLKRYSEALEGEDMEKSQTLLKELVSLTDRAATKGVLHKRRHRDTYQGSQRGFLILPRAPAPRLSARRSQEEVSQEVCNCSRNCF